MIKIKPEQLEELFCQIEYYLAGIKETCRMGGDVLPNIEGQAEALEKVLVQFKASYLVSPGDEILPNKKTTFLTIVDTLLKEPAKSQF